MLKDREPIRMADREVEFESPIVKTEGEQVRLVTSAILAVAEGAARYSVSPTPTSIIEIGEARDNEAIAKALAAVSIEDPNLRKIDLASNEGIAQAAILTLAKTKALEKEVKDPKVKTRLEKFSGGLSESVSNVLVKVGGRKAVTGAAALSLMATACSTAVGAQGPEIAVPTPEAPATLIAPAPTEELNEIATAQRFLTEEKLLAAIDLSDDPDTPQIDEGFLNRQSFEKAFAEYQEALSQEFAGASFARWGIESTMLEGGPIVSPFFETLAPDGKTLDVALLVGEGPGKFEIIRLLPVEVEFDGKTYLTLSQTISADTGEEMSPEPFFWIPFSRQEWENLSPEEKEKVAPFFNGLGGIIPEAQNIPGTKISSLKEIFSPELTVDTRQFEAKWVSEGYVEDLRYGGSYTVKEHEVGGETREFIVYRVGFTEIWFDKAFSEAIGGQILIPNPSLTEVSLEHIQRWGALVHALNIGRVISGNQYDYDPEWFTKFLEDLSAHTGETYSFKAYRSVSGGNEQYEIGIVDPSKPFRFFMLPPAMDFETATKTPGGESAPWQLQFNNAGGFTGVKISLDGALNIYQTDSYNDIERILTEPEEFVLSTMWNAVYFGAISSSRIDHLSRRIDQLSPYSNALNQDFYLEGNFYTNGKWDTNRSFIILASPPQP